MRRVVTQLVVVAGVAIGVGWWLTGRGPALRTGGLPVAAPIVGASPAPATSAARLSPVSVVRRTVERGPTPSRADGSPSPAPTNSAALPDAIPGEFALWFFDERDQQRFIALARARGVQILGSMGFGHAVRVKVKSREQLDELLKDGPRPIGSSPNFYVHVPDPEDPGKNKRAGGERYVAFGADALHWLGLTGDRAGWGKGVVVAVLDTGVGAHPALQGVSVERLDILDPGTPGPSSGAHATAVASLIAGRSGDIAGVAPEAGILSVRVLADDGTGNTFSLAQGIVEAVDRGAKVINISAGSRGDSALVRQAIEYARQQGVAVVAAVGNEGVQGVSYPARYDGVLAVTTVDADGRLPFFANRGDEVGLAAPGVGVLAASPNQQTALFSGTSASTPLVSGAVAALLSRNPGMSADEAIALLEEYADDAGAPGKDAEFGNGILDLARLENRDTKGIRDIAVCGLYLAPCASADEDPLLVISAQNRGTEDLYCVYLDVALDGVASRQSFYNVRVGQTVSYPQRVSRARLSQRGIAVAYAASIDGGGDANRANDARQGTISLRDVNVDPGE